MTRDQRATCARWEQQIIDGKQINELPDFNPDLILTYWQAEGFRREAIEPLKRQFSEWFKACN